MKRPHLLNRARLAAITIAATGPLLALLAAAPAQATSDVPTGVCSAELDELTAKQADHTAARTTLADAKTARVSATSAYLSDPTPANLTARNTARQGVTTAKAAVATAKADRVDARVILDTCLASAPVSTASGTNFRLSDNNGWGCDMVVGDLTFTGLDPNTTYRLFPVAYCGMGCASDFRTDSTGTYRTADDSSYATIGWGVANCLDPNTTDQTIHTTDGTFVRTDKIALPAGICGI